MATTLSTNPVRTAALGPRRTVRVPRPRGPVSVRMVTVQRWPSKDSKHRELAEEIRDEAARLLPGLWPAVDVADATQGSARAALSVPADVVVICAHSGWRSDDRRQWGTWTDLLGVPVEELKGSVDAGVLVLATCNLLDAPPALDSLVVRPTPAFACRGWAYFTHTPVLIAPLVAELARGGRTRDWAGRLDAAAAAAKAGVREDCPLHDWDRWQPRLLDPGPRPRR